eukprot:CAMPEP_0176473224 /NCGR_PEP_ID=MMETSP0127-20121128/42179_1 /TAXON_ID=938130 /ORGANISM="Platyophrya macrostoma, Strain WH" /LENGTH=657 /DNA_ID=CAMNT_0017868179 /DNA_START=25 /DNA_END=1995 /DNA_ORIENTATION=+
MPTVLSKVDTFFKGSFTNYLWSNPKRKAISISILFIVLYLVKLRATRSKARENIKLSPTKEKKGGKGNVDSVFLKRILTLIRIVVPSWKSKEVFNLGLLTVLLVVRTFLSIYISSINGRIVKSIVKRNLPLFIRRIISLAALAIPSSFVNSYIEYLGKILALDFRTNLTNFFHESYLKEKIFYQVCNLDSRVSNPDQRLTQDIEKWASSLSNLYSNLSKPLLDIVLFSRKLAELLGWKGPFLCIAWYFLAGIVLRVISPPFGKLTAIEQKFEGEYRASHVDLLHHAEEIAFYRGSEWEKTRVNEHFDNLINHSKYVLVRKMGMGCFDGMLVKYGAVLVGYAILGLPVFGAGKEAYLKKVGNDPGAITRDYIRNSSLLINLAKAIGRLVVSYKEIQALAGYTSLVDEIKVVLRDLQSGKYNRIQVGQAKDTTGDSKKSRINLSQGEIEESESIKFENVPIVSPNGDVLVEKINFEIKRGMNCIISGPNGCGKSSLFRILGSLWPIFGGKLYRPSLDKMFYIPQRPYLPAGTLRDQIIYPHSKLQMLRRKIQDSDIKKLLDTVQLGYLIEREGNLDTENDWNDVLSGGEKQRIAMARLFYHRPQFAILDECTSAVSLDVEAILYNHSRELGITLFTVSHRLSLFKYHEYILKFDGEGNW